MFFAPMCLWFDDIWATTRHKNGKIIPRLQFCFVNSEGGINKKTNGDYYKAGMHFAGSSRDANSYSKSKTWSRYCASFCFCFEGFSGRDHSMQMPWSLSCQLTLGVFQSLGFHCYFSLLLFTGHFLPFTFLVLQPSVLFILQCRFVWFTNNEFLIEPLSFVITLLRSWKKTWI